MNFETGKMLTIGKFIFLSAAFFVFSQTYVAQSAGANVEDQAKLVSEFEVNGLKVLVKRRISAPTVSAGLFIRGGVRNLSDNNGGIEGFMLSVAAEASKKYPREVLRREIAGTGGSIGAGSNNDYSVMSLASTRVNFEKTWDMFTDIILNPTFDSKDIERIRDGILTGLREQESDADNFLNILGDRMLFRNHPYGKDVGGTIQTISKFSKNDLNEYHGKLFETSRLLLVVVGDIDAEEMKKKVEASFGKLPRGNYKETPLPPLDFSKPTLDVTQRQLPTNYVKGIFAAPSLESPDYAAMRVAMAILQRQLFQEVRVRRQLSYAPNAEIDDMFANTAHIYVTAVEANEAVSVMLDEIDNLKRYLINEEEIAGIGGHFLTLHYLDQQTNGAQTGELAKYELIGGGWRNSFQLINRIRKVTPKDIQEAAKKYMKNVRFVVVGNPQAIDKSKFIRN